MEMNASARLFVNDAHAVKVARLLACVAMGALLSSCANPFATAAVDPTSPIAADVAGKGAEKRAFPKFTDIPPLPTDVRPAPAFGKAAAKIEAARDDLYRETAANTWTLDETTVFAAGAERAAGPTFAPGAQDAAATEALARRLRERATPPPLSR